MRDRWANERILGEDRVPDVGAAGSLGPRKIDEHLEKSAEKLRLRAKEHPQPVLQHHGRAVVVRGEPRQAHFGMHCAILGVQKGKLAGREQDDPHKVQT